MLDDSGPVDKSETKAAGGLTAFMAGILTLTVFIWAGPSHTYFGENWVFVFETPLVIFGALLVVGGFLIVLREVLRYISQNTEVPESRILKVLVK